MYALNEPSFEIATIRAYTAVPLHALCGIMMGFLITQSIFEKENNYLNNEHLYNQIYILYIKMK